MRWPVRSDYRDHYVFGGEEWDLEFKRIVTDSDGNPCHGTADYQKNLIEIERTTDDKSRLSTFIHELIHIIEPDLPEHQVRKLEEGIMDFLESNFIDE